jgi:RsiW-degrading membrane proteinase PrsW (M82 family)
MDVPVVVTALSYGLVPVFIWLVFWLFEDRERPEPKRNIARALLAGMIAVPLAVTIEAWVETFTSDDFLRTLLWSLTEESLKYVLAVILVLRSRDVDEALDALIYMICVALGFAAIENTLYTLQPLMDAEHIGALNLTSLRFIGATLVHVLSSAAIGVCMALTFYKSETKRALGVMLGLAIATSLHALFNFFIIKVSLEAVFIVFAVVWIVTLGLILIAERIKKLDAYYTARF